MILAQKIAYGMSLAPLAFCCWRWRGHQIDAQWWIMAEAFAVSFLADSVSRSNPSAAWLVSLVYPVSQTLLIAAVLLPRRDTLWFAGAIVMAGLLSIAWRGTDGPEILLRSVAWLGLCGLIVDRWALGPLRTALLVSFGLGWFAWLGRSLWPILPWWYIGQTVRLAGLLLFCRAMTVTRPALSVVRGMARA